MKRQYDKQEITRILGKFMTGETSLEEEQILAQYFRTHEVGDEWQEYKEMFALFDSGEVDVELDDTSNQIFNDGNEKIKMLSKAVIEKPKIISIRWLVTGIAASVLLLLAFHYITNDVKPKVQPEMAQQTEQQQGTERIEKTKQLQEAPVVASSTPVKRNKKAKEYTKVAPSVPQVDVALNVRLIIDTRDEQAESEFKAQIASVRLRGEEVMHHVVELNQQEIDNYQIVEL